MKQYIPLLIKNSPVPGSLTRCSGLVGLLIVVLVSMLLQACRPKADDGVRPDRPAGKGADQYSADVALQWSALQLKLTRTTAGFSPPVASRALGYAGLTLYEAVAPGIGDHQSLAGQLDGLTVLPKPEPGKSYNWAVSANAAQAFIIRNLYPTTSAANRITIDSLERSLLNQVKDGDTTVNQRSAAFGRKIAEALYNYSRTDGGHEGYSTNFPADYVVPTGVGLWQPTENGEKIPLQPYWGLNRTFVKANKDLSMPSPLLYSTSSSSVLFNQYLDVYTKSKNLTQAEKEVAVWWADNPGETFTPPGHSYNIARIVVASTKADLAKAAETFARTGISVSDAFVLCWRCKYTFNNMRPYTYVRLAIDPNWLPFWPTPPFPGFPSGHATQSSSVATVLSALYGDSFRFVDDSHAGRKKDSQRNVEFNARTYRSFTEAAQEAANSRLYGSIHTRQDNETGLIEGRKIGANVNALAWKK